MMRSVFRCCHADQDSAVLTLRRSPYHNHAVDTADAGFALTRAYNVLCFFCVLLKL